MNSQSTEDDEFSTRDKILIVIGSIIVSIIMLIILKLLFGPDSFMPELASLFIIGVGIWAAINVDKDQDMEKNLES